MIAAEKLLRIALFSDELPMNTEFILKDRRKKLAGTIRAFRKKGVIPVFVSTLWFLLALAISIQGAFSRGLGNRGSNQQAHDLALGLLLCFLPIFILSSVSPPGHIIDKLFHFNSCANTEFCRCIVDRNTIAPERIASKLNMTLLAPVRKALRDDGLRKIYEEHIQAPSDFFDWVHKLDESFDNFFTDYAGQARVRWHYGVARSLLCSFENSFMAKNGRDWLTEDNANKAKTFVSSLYPFLINGENGRSSAEHKMCVDA